MPPLTLSAEAGLATYVSDLRRPTTKAKVLNNVNQVKRGVVTSRVRGWERVRADDFNGGAKFLGFSEFILAADGSKNLIFQVGDKIYSYDFGTETETEIANSLDPAAIPNFAMFQPYASGPSFGIFSNGEDEPLKITDLSTSAAFELNGSAYGGGAATTSPMPAKSYGIPKFVVPFLDRLLIFGFPDDDTRYDVLITNTGEAEVVTQSSPLIPTDGDMRQLPPRLGDPTGGISFRLSNADNIQIALIACENGVCMLSGTDATNFSLTVLTEEYGIPSNHTWIPLYNDMWFFSDKGLTSFSTLASNSSLLTDMLSMDIQDIIARVNPAHAYKIHAYHNKRTQDIVVWLPLDANTECQDAIIANYNNDFSQPGRPVPQWFTKSGTTVTASIYFNKESIGGGIDGVLQRHYVGTKYDTAPVPFEIMTALMGVQNPLKSMQIQEIGVVCEGAAQRFIMNAFQYVRTVKESMIRNQAKPQDFRMTADDTGTQTILDSWIADSSSFPADQVKVLKQYSCLGACDFVEFQIKGQDEDDNIDFVQIVADVDMMGNKI